MGCVRCGGEALCPKCDSVIPAGDAVGVVAALTAEIATLHVELEMQTKAMGELAAERDRLHSAYDDLRNEVIVCVRGDEKYKIIPSERLAEILNRPT